VTEAFLSMKSFCMLACGHLVVMASGAMEAVYVLVGDYLLYSENTRVMSYNEGVHRLLKGRSPSQ